MKIAITAESTIDLPKNLLSEFEISTLPFTLIMGEKQALDGEADSKDLFDYVAKTGQLPHTAAVNDFQFEEFFRTKLKEADHIIHFSLSSKISAAYSNAERVSHEEEFEGKVSVIDTLSLSTGIALLSIKASKMAKEGKSVEEIVKASESQKALDQTSFVIETLDYLYKGGRCSKLAVFGANLLNLKPQIVMAEGSMKPGKKYKGTINKAIKNYVSDTLEQFPNADKSLVFITNTIDDAHKGIIDEVKTTLKKFGFERIEPTTAGGTIACHCGPNTLGILYLLK